MVVDEEVLQSALARISGANELTHDDETALEVEAAVANLAQREAIAIALAASQSRYDQLNAKREAGKQQAAKKQK